MVGNGDAAKLGNFSPRLTLRCTPNTAPAVFLTLELVFLVNGSLHYMSNTRKKTVPCRNADGSTHTAILCHQLRGSHQAAISTECAPQYAGAIILNRWQDSSSSTSHCSGFQSDSHSQDCLGFGKRLLPIQWKVLSRCRVSLSHVEQSLDLRVVPMTSSGTICKGQCSSAGPL